MRKDRGTIEREIMDICARYDVTFKEPILSELTLYVMQEALDARQSVVDALAAYLKGEK